MSFAADVASMDRDVIANLGGDLAVYVAASSQEVPVTGIFNRLPMAAAETRSGVAMAAPSFFCRVSDLTENPENRNDEPKLTVAGKEHRVYEALVDDEGGCLLLLREVNS